MGMKSAIKYMMVAIGLIVAFVALPVFILQTIIEASPVTVFAVTLAWDVVLLAGLYGYADEGDKK